MDNNMLTFGFLGLIVVGFIVWKVVPFLTKAAKIGKSLFSKIYLNKNSMLTEEQYKKIALGAIYSEQQSAFINSLSTGVLNLNEILRKWWGINNREDALSKLDYLKGKGYRFYFPTVYKAFLTANGDEHQILLDAFLEDEDQEKAHLQLEYLKETIDELKAGKIIAHESDLPKYGVDGWDSGRLVFLARLCFDAGYISEIEAWGYINAANDIARSKFDSWESYSKSYIIGRGMWGGVASANMGIMDISEYLLQEPESPWVQIRW